MRTSNLLSIFSGYVNEKRLETCLYDNDNYFLLKVSLSICLKLEVWVGMPSFGDAIYVFLSLMGHFSVIDLYFSPFRHLFILLCTRNTCNAIQ